MTKALPDGKVADAQSMTRNERQRSVEPLVSIIIPCRYPDAEVRECVAKCLQMDYRNIEIVVAADSANGDEVPDAKVISVGRSRPSRKRNLAANVAAGEILAFIDADAYPEKTWLCRAVGRLGGDVGIVGGPALTPQDSSLGQQASGIILASPFGGGRMSFRYAVKEFKECTELPSCNLIVSKADFDAVGGYDEELLTAEDAKLCFQIRERGKRVLYAPDVVVFHNRRSLFRPHLKQIWNYGKDKAFLFKTMPGFATPFYFIPAAFIVWLIAGLTASFLFEPFRYAYIASLALYVAMAMLTGILTKGSWKLRSMVVIGVVATHLAYGLGFMAGLVQKRANGR